MKPKTLPQMPDQNSDDYKNLVDLLSVFSEATHRLAEMEANINAEFMTLVDGYKEAFSEMQKTLANATTALETIAVKHQAEWFKESKTLKTPYGSVRFVESNSIQVTNEELSIELLKRDAKMMGLDPNHFIRTTTELNLDALSVLDDAQLKAFRLARIKKDNFSATAAKVNLGKAVKEAVQTRPEAA